MSPIQPGGSTNVCVRFLLPALNIDEVLEQTNRDGIRRTLQQLPSGLSAAFGKVMERIERLPEARRDLAKSVILWVSHVQRPITLDELREAIAATSNPSCLNPESLTPGKILIEFCQGLVAVDEKTSIVRLVHSAFQEYIQAHKEILFPRGDKLISLACISYLSVQDFNSGSLGQFSFQDVELASRDQLSNASINEFKFRDYAEHFWGDHARQDFDNRGVNNSSRLTLT